MAQERRKMKKIINIVVVFGFLLFLSLGEIFAGSLTVRIEKPSSPTSKKDFRIDFVSLDLEQRTVQVDCYYKKPGGSFSLFESKNLKAGGDSGYCQVDSGEISERRVYDFYVVANAGSDSITSASVAVEYDDIGPGTPTDYSRVKQLDGCSYEIKFKTANDNNETAKVELYRSMSAYFTADSNTRIAQVGMGSNLESKFFTTLPDCAKEYFFAIRAFDGAGNGSGVVGDMGGVVSIPRVGEGVGAIRVNESQILGEETLQDEASNGEEEGTPSPEVLGGETDVAEEEKKGTNRLFLWVAGIGVLMGMGLVFFRRQRK